MELCVLIFENFMYSCKHENTNLAHECSLFINNFRKIIKKKQLHFVKYFITLDVYVRGWTFDC